MDLRDSEIEILESTRSAVPEIGRSANLKITILTDPAIQRFIGTVGSKYRPRNRSIQGFPRPRIYCGPYQLLDPE